MFASFAAGEETENYLALARQAAARSRGLPRPSRVVAAEAALADLLSMSVRDFAEADCALEVRVAWWPETLFFVPEVQDAEALWHEGVSREHVWTAHALLVLLSGPPPAPDGLQIILIARREFAGEAVAARPRRD